MTLLLPQIPGSRRVVPLVVDPSDVDHLRLLLGQAEVWVTRARWSRWLATGAALDTTPISTMLHDDRLAACAWLRQQQHVLYATLEDDGDRAPHEWIADQPLYEALLPDST